MTLKTFLLCASALTILTTNANAAPPPNAKVRHTDRNKDGVVTRREIRAEKRWEHKQKSKVNQPWEYKADADKDGVVEPAEIRLRNRKRADVNNDGVIDAVKRKAYWPTWRNKVNTPLEAKYDANNDGYIDWGEAQAMLRDRLTVIDTGGQAIVNTDIERAFDGNNNGVIDATEAAAIRQALN